MNPSCLLMGMNTLLQGDKEGSFEAGAWIKSYAQAFTAGKWQGEDSNNI